MDSTGTPTDIDMPTPVDQLSFAELITRHSDLIDEWRSIVREVLIQSLTGPGPFILSAADHGGKSLLISNGASTTTINARLPLDAPVGTVFIVDQVGTSPVKFVTQAGGLLRHRLGHDGTAGQWASISAKCVKNVSGSAAEWLISGDTADLP